MTVMINLKANVYIKYMFQWNRVKKSIILVTVEVAFPSFTWYTFKCHHLWFVVVLSLYLLKDEL